MVELCWVKLRGAGHKTIGAALQNRCPLFPMDTTLPIALLGGISPEKFMRTYWHKKPLLIRQAIPGFKPILNRAQLLALALSLIHI